jgi:hypothetical protein
MDLCVEAQALVSKLAPLGAALVKFRVGKNISATLAAPFGVVFEKLHLCPAGRADDVKDVSRFPELSVLSRAHGSHKKSSFKKILLFGAF